MTAPTILQIIPRLETGGAEKTTVEMTQALVEAGARALVATSGGRLCEEIERLGGQVIDFPAATKKPWEMLANVKKLSQVIGDMDVDLVHARSRAPAWSALMACQSTGRPFVTTYHGAYGAKNFVKNFYNSVMARGDLVIANSKFTARLIRKHHKTSEEKLRVVYRGVDVNRFSAGADSVERALRLRESWKVGAGAKIILHAARLTDWKGQRIVIKAAGELNRRGVLDDVVFVLAGSDQGRSQYVRDLKALIKQEKAQNRVVLAGHVEDMNAAYATAHCAVVASTLPEAFGRAAVEAQAAGLPVIVTQIGASPETVLGIPAYSIDKATGLFVPPGDEDALAEAVISLFSLNDADRSIFGQRARAHVAQNFSLAQMALQTLKIYDELLGTRLGPTYLSKVS